MDRDNCITRLVAWIEADPRALDDPRIARILAVAFVDLLGVVASLEEKLAALDRAGADGLRPEDRRIRSAATGSLEEMLDRLNAVLDRLPGATHH